MDVTFAVQSSAKGMGDAVQQVREHVTEQFVVTGPYRFDIDTLLDSMLPADDADGVVTGTETGTPERYGMLALDAEHAHATGVVEKPDAADAPSPYKITSTYILGQGFFEHLEAVERHEYSFEDALDRYMDACQVRFVEQRRELPSLKYPWDVFSVAEAVLDRQERRVADSTDVADSAVVDGDVVIAEDVTVYENAVIRGPCYIGPGSTVGNGAVVRAYTNLEAEATVGAHAEVRGTVAGQRFSCHSGFIGDSVVGDDVAVGAGTTVANRLPREDGERPEIEVHVAAKDETVGTGRDRVGVFAGDGVAIGTQANLMPGVCIGAGSFVGPSTLVTENVGEAKTCYTRHDQTVTERR
jgi:bifunctional UDP-N-acetylglucosamine pyrophosphorylase/glucosamine-1-phosphate N-acetyltransferase